MVKVISKLLLLLNCSVNTLLDSFTLMIKYFFVPFDQTFKSPRLDSSKSNVPQSQEQPKLAD